MRAGREGGREGGLSSSKYFLTRILINSKAGTDVFLSRERKEGREGVVCCISKRTVHMGSAEVIREKRRESRLKNNYRSG